MKSTLLVSVVVLPIISGLVSRGSDLPDPATKAQVPPIAYVQGMIWKRLDLTNFTLNGSIRSDKTKVDYPLTLLTNGHVQEYDFQNQPLQIRVEISPGASNVEKRTSASGPWVPVTGEAKEQPILGTDVTYEDLGVDFVNWDDVVPLGIDSIKTLRAYVFEATPGPKDHSRFAKVRYWVSSQYWAFLRIDGLNAQDQTVKRVEIQDIMQIGKFTVFKEMKVGTMDPERDDIAKSMTYIDIQDGKEGSTLSK